MSARKAILSCGCLTQAMHDILPQVEALLHHGGMTDEKIGDILRHDEDVDGTPAGIARRRETHPDALPQARADIAAGLARAAAAVAAAALRDKR